MTKLIKEASPLYQALSPEHKKYVDEKEFLKMVMEASSPKRRDKLIEQVSSIR